MHYRRLNFKPRRQQPVPIWEDQLCQIFIRQYRLGVIMPEIQFYHQQIYAMAKELCFRPSVWAGDRSNLQGWRCQISQISITSQLWAAQFNRHLNSPPISSLSFNTCSNNCISSNWWIQLSPCKSQWWTWHLKKTNSSRLSSVPSLSSRLTVQLISLSDFQLVLGMSVHAYIRLR